MYGSVKISAGFVSGVTRVDHDTPGERRIASCAERGCDVHRIHYRSAGRAGRARSRSTRGESVLPNTQLAALVELSGHCEQTFRVRTVLLKHSMVCSTTFKHGFQSTHISLIHTLPMYNIIRLSCL